MSASSTTRVEPEPPTFPTAASGAASGQASEAGPARTESPDSGDASPGQLARMEEKLARIEEKLARSEAQILRMEDRIEHNSSVTGVLASQESVDRVYSRLRLLPGFPSLIVAAVLAGVIAAALIALVQRFGAGA